MLQHQRTKEQLMEDEKEYRDILNHNREYASMQGLEFFQQLAKGQHPSFMMISCSDSRVSPELIVESQPGEIFSHRNIANQVLPADFNVQTVIQYAVEHLHVPHIIVMGHTQCGGIAAAYQRQTQGGMLDLWLANIRKIMLEHHLHLHSCKNDEERILFMVKQNVRDQVHNLWKNSFVQKALQDGSRKNNLQIYYIAVWIHGWVFHIETGEVEDVMIEKSMPADLVDAFKLKFLKHE